MAARLGVAALAFALLGCAAPVPTPTQPANAVPTIAATPTTTATPTLSPWPSDHEVSANLVLQMWHTEGAPLQGQTFWLIPEFSLYDDGQAIYMTPGVPWNESLLHARLTREQLDALIADALGPGGLSTNWSEYNDVGIESTHDFFVWDGQHAHNVTVQGLGKGDSDAPSAAERVKFKWLADRLSNFDNDVRAGKAQALGDYLPAGYRVWLAPPYDGTSVNGEWPWPELTMDDFPILPMTVWPSRRRHLRAGTTRHRLRDRHQLGRSSA